MLRLWRAGLYILKVVAFKASTHLPTVYFFLACVNQPKVLVSSIVYRCQQSCEQKGLGNVGDYTAGSNVNS
jgi:hypothetical protein